MSGDSSFQTVAATEGPDILFQKKGLRRLLGLLTLKLPPVLGGPGGGGGGPPNGGGGKLELPTDEAGSGGGGGGNGELL